MIGWRALSIQKSKLSLTQKLKLAEESDISYTTLKWYLLCKQHMHELLWKHTRAGEKKNCLERLKPES
jgi:hypothetical protein